QPGHIATGRGRIHLHQFRGVGETLDGGGGDGIVDDRLFLVDQHQPQVHERVTQRGHFPVQDGAEGPVLGDQHVVQPVVAVYDSGLCRLGDRGTELFVQLVDTGDLTTAGGVQLFVPPAYLTLQETLGTTEVAQPHLGGVDRVQITQRGDQGTRHPADTVGAKSGELRGGPVRGTGHVFHDEERCAQHLGVLAQQVGARNRYGGVTQRGHHLVLAGHVVRGRQDVPQGWATHHPAPHTVGDDVGQVGLAARDPRTAEFTRDQPRYLALHVGT